MTKIISSLHIDIPFGVDVLRNGTKAAIAIVYAIGGLFVRCNILSGALLTDQEIIEENPAPIMRYRKNLAPTIEVFADVLVKHAYPLIPISLQDVAWDTAYRALADSLIGTGSRSGVPPLLGDLKAVKEAVPNRPLLAGNSVTPRNVSLSWTLLRDSLWVQHSKKGEELKTRWICSG